MSGVNTRKMDLKSILGLLSLAASLALISPGVQVVRADETPAGAPPAERAQETPAAGVCSPDASPAPTATAARMAEAARQRLRRQAAASSDLPVVLNTRGYNYTSR